jgi:hypothetical protein
MSSFSDGGTLYGGHRSRIPEAEAQVIHAKAHQAALANLKANPPGTPRNEIYQANLERHPGRPGSGRTPVARRFDDLDRARNQYKTKE